MLSRKHKLKIGETGLVGNVTSTGKPRIALDVGQDAVHFKNPLLPETRSEIALPLKVGDYVIGALDVQSQEAAAFDEESLAVLQVMADQLAIAIQNTQLLQEVQDNLSELEAAYGRFGRQAWQRCAQTSPVIGYEFNRVGVTPILREEKGATNARQTGSGPLQRPASIPLKLRGETIGTLEIWPQEGELSEEDFALLTNLGSRIGQILDSARLFEDAQVRAAREQTINRLTASIARALDTDGVLRAAVRELGELPAVSEASIYLGPVLAGAEASVMQSPETNASPDNNGHEPTSSDEETP
jgi:GAF domain-containing protein